MERVVVPATFHFSLMECLHQLKSAGTQNFSSLRNSLYNYLIAPMEPRLTNIKHLIIIPDEELFLFPFETLSAKTRIKFQARFHVPRIIFSGILRSVIIFLLKHGPMIRQIPGHLKQPPVLPVLPQGFMVTLMTRFLRALYLSH